MHTCLAGLVGLVLALTLNASGSVLFVDLNSANPTPPYTSWATAAANIQDAVDAASAGDLIVASNGTYSAGGRTVNGYGLTNRIAVTKPVTLQSFAGPSLTVIRGNSPLGANAVRCVYLTNGATLSGFTLTNGATLTSGDLIREQGGGGVLCESSAALVTNCVFMGNSASFSGGGVNGGTLTNCTLSRNSAALGGGGKGGGAYGCSLNSCTLTGGSAHQAGGAEGCTLNYCTVSTNSASWGGGAADSVLNHCTLVRNTSYDNGGGVEYGTLSNCTLIGNQAQYGGGVDSCHCFSCVFSNNSTEGGGGATASYLDHCLLVGNKASGDGGGAETSSLVNCLLINNSSGYRGGGAYSGSLYNCTLVGNSAVIGGGAYSSAACWDSILYYNTNSTGQPDNWVGGYMSNCCAIPLGLGINNFTNAPGFVDLAGGDFHLGPGSPCINSGNNTFVTANNAFITITNDFDGNPRIVGGTVDSGAYEYQGQGSLISYAWLQQYGLPTDGSADRLDLDGDGLNNWQEWVSGTDPRNPASVLRMLSPSNNASGIALSWEGVSGKTYYLQRSTNLWLLPAFSSIQSNIVGQAGTTSFTDTNAPNSGPYFYRVGVQQ